MRCHICDVVLDEPKFNKDTNTYEPCGTCMAIILETAGTHVDRPYADDGDLSDERPGYWANVFSSGSDEP